MKSRNSPEDAENEDKNVTEVTDVRTIMNSEYLAKILSSGRSISEFEEESKVLVDNAQSDMKSYLSLYARSQLNRVEKLTRYLDRMEDKLIEEADYYSPKDFLKAMNALQQSLNSAIELIKLVGTDERYLNIFYTENNTLINNINSNSVDISLSRESREKLRNLISKINEF